MKTRSMTEQVIYRPGSGRPRELTVLVDRQGREGQMHTATPVITMTLLNDQVVGVDPALLDLGTDRIDVGERVGGSLLARNIQRIVNQDNEFVTVEVK